MFEFVLVIKSIQAFNRKVYVNHVKSYEMQTTCTLHFTLLHTFKSPLGRDQLILILMEKELSDTVIDSKGPDIDLKQMCLNNFQYTHISILILYNTTS